MLNNNYNLLIVDDAVDVLDTFEVIAEGIEQCKIFTAINLAKAIEIVSQEVIDMAIIDVVLGETDGYTVCKTLREMPNAYDTYIIMMSSDRHHLIDRIKAFNVGAQEFLSKPFDLKEVELIIASKINFFNKLKTEPVKVNEEHIHTAGKFLIDDRVQNLIVGEQVFALTSSEYQVMRFFILNPERIIPIEEIILKIWDNSTTPENVRALIHRLRGKLEGSATKQTYFVNAKGSGYIFYPAGDPPNY
jgi:DNA-binding response OmpR family regulator